MAWFRRTNVTSARDPRPARWVGFANENPNLYEFTTAGGDRVSLHDAYFESLRYEVGAPSDVVLTFVLGEDRELPTEPGRQCMGGSRIMFRFGDAYIIMWESSQEEPDYRSDRAVPHGQVGDFRVYDSRCFAIEMIDDAIYVEASTIEVSIEPISADELESVLARVAGA